ncbi:dynein axonemal heavy chain 1 [Myxocyprinus asiaticus]|uniref:dynein axonemal heavy chain 1 n=1 Tax=Myxocyprinus asiaticus TaxID=70543 RepID=UPI0022213E81|nr:dynein axonemal heavy chain 1 [Myxocyprinus asiaticus]
MQDACKECKAISKQLFEKPSSIEELTEQREWMKQIPEQLKVHEESLFKALSDYDLVDEFFYHFSDEDVNEKWTAMFFPWKIMSQMETVRAQHSEDEERFYKIQLVDQNNFLERLSELQMVVAGLAAHTNIERAHEVANKVRRVSKQLKECEEMAQLYNNRERLFGKPLSTYTELQRLNQEFQPFHDMWRMASDWLRWHESWLSDPLSAVNPEQLEQNVNDAYQTMHQCIQQFKDIPACQAVASEIQAKIEEFRPFIPLIRGLRKLGTQSRHWELLSERINVDVMPKANLTFSHCLELGLQAHVEEITRMAQEDGKEYECQE